MNGAYQRRLIGVLLCLGAGAAPADDVALAAVENTTCRLTLESRSGSDTLVVRAHSAASGRCLVSESELLQLLENGLSSAGARAGTYRSIFLGRLVQYPSMSRDLALAAVNDKGWDARAGRALGANDNKLVARLTMRVLPAGITQTLDRAGYRLAAVSVEKVLVAHPRDIPHYAGPAIDGRLPFDAQAWLTLAKKDSR